MFFYNRLLALMYLALPTPFLLEEDLKKLFLYRFGIVKVIDVNDRHAIGNRHAFFSLRWQPAVGIFLSFADHVLAVFCKNLSK